MSTITFPLSVTHSQIAVFDSALDKPFSFWTDRHVQQGFAWRPGSVSFSTIEEGGRHLVEVVTASEDAQFASDAVRVIQVPFDVPASGSIEVASVVHGVPLSLPAGKYALRFEAFQAKEDPVRLRLTFVRRDNPTFEILRADAGISIPPELLVTASPA